MSRDRSRAYAWKDLLTTGMPLMVKRLSVAMTTLENTVTLNVPDVIVTGKPTQTLLN